MDDYPPLPDRLWQSWHRLTWSSIPPIGIRAPQSAGSQQGRQCTAAGRPSGPGGKRWHSHWHSSREWTQGPLIFVARRKRSTSKKGSRLPWSILTRPPFCQGLLMTPEKQSSLSGDGWLWWCEQRHTIGSWSSRSGDISQPPLIMRMPIDMIAIFAYFNRQTTINTFDATRLIAGMLIFQRKKTLPKIRSMARTMASFPWQDFCLLDRLHDPPPRIKTPKNLAKNGCNKSITHYFI